MTSLWAAATSKRRLGHPNRLHFLNPECVRIPWIVAPKKFPLKFSGTLYPQSFQGHQRSWPGVNHLGYRSFQSHVTQICENEFFCYIFQPKIIFLGYIVHPCNLIDEIWISTSLVDRPAEQLLQRAEWCGWAVKKDLKYFYLSLSSKRFLINNLFNCDHLEVNKLAIAMKFCSAGSHSKDKLVKE